jgi:hypothetical protein
VAIAASIAFGLFVISRGVILEPPAFISNWIAAITERLAKRLAAPQ